MSLARELLVWKLSGACLGNGSHPFQFTPGRFAVAASARRGSASGLFCSFASDRVVT